MAGSDVLTVAVVALMTILSAAAVSAQDLSPAQAPEAGSAFSVGASGAVICSSVLLSVLALLKN